MPTSTKRVLHSKRDLVKPIIASEYDDILSLLNEHLPSPLWSEQVEMTHHLNLHVNGALFTYDNDGWSYVEEGA
jgi:hypothetical protein